MQAAGKCHEAIVAYGEWAQVGKLYDKVARCIQIYAALNRMNVESAAKRRAW